jgi:3-oxoacyl-[acyl-carrier protein] reductase
VTSEDEVAAMTASVVERFGGIDILVNTAGGTGPIETPAKDYPVEEFRKDPGAQRHRNVPPLQARDPASDRSRRRTHRQHRGNLGAPRVPEPVGYSSSKWAIRGFTRTLALELGPHDITVNDVCPNVTNGSRMDKIVAEKARVLGRTPEEVYADFERQTALGRFVEEEDIANAIDFLVSDGARNITGHDIPVDAGWDV